MNFLRKQSSRTQPLPTTSIATAHPSISPLDIPEILELIFSFISDSTIQRTVARVCRLWLLMNHNRLLRNVVWNSTWSKPELDTASFRLVGAVRLHCYVSMVHPTSDGHQSDVREFLIECQYAFEQQQQPRQMRDRQQQESVAGGESNKQRTTATTTFYTFSPLRELHFEILTGFGDIILDNYPFCFGTLTSLILTCRHTNAETLAIGNLSNILRSCHLLESFEAHGTIGLVFTWTPFIEGQQTPLPLQALILDNATFHYDSLENLLTFTPELKVLKLIAMPSSLNAGYNYTAIEWSRLLRHIRSLSTPLTTIHLSSENQPTSPQVLKEMLEICPVLPEWNLWALDVTTSLLQKLDLHTNRLTTLIFYPNNKHLLSTSCRTEFGRPQPVHPAIHEFLCTSDTLVHLMTLKTVARLEDFDIHGRAGYCIFDNSICTGSVNVHATSISNNISSSINTPGPAIWRCRNLRTLHLKMQGPGDVSLAEPIHSRIIFGYIARVFPHLKELELSTPVCCFSRVRGMAYMPKICMELRGGACLLGRLKELQRLRLVLPDDRSAFSNCREADLNWMVVPSSTFNFASKRWRRKEVERWQQARIQEDQAEARRSQQQMVVSEDPEVLVQLRNLGLLKDVEEMVKEMDEDSFRAMPSLEGLAFTQLYFSRPEDEIRRCTPVVNKLWFPF